MPSEMLSGPDLGGGYLHQLTIDREPGRTTYTFHAQEGGQDAAGPPKGPLDVFGSVHPETACQFGGPRCWHRRFLLPFSELPRVRQAYNRTRFVLAASLDQAYAGAPVGIRPALAELVRRIGPPLRDASIDWFVGGSTATWLAGVPLAPHDIDLGTTRAGVDRIAELVPEYLIEPVGPTDWPPRGLVHAARAFVGTFQQGARVEWAVSLGPTDGSSRTEWDVPPAEVQTRSIEIDGAPVRFAVPEYGLVRAAAHGEIARLRAIGESVRKHAVDRALLTRLTADAHPQVRAAVFGAIDG